MEPEKDPLDLPSGCFVEEPYCEHVFKREISFRELQEMCESDIALWDSIGRSMRALNQKANDPNYRPIQPMEGLKRLKPVHRWWRPV